MTGRWKGGPYAALGRGGRAKDALSSVILTDLLLHNNNCSWDEFPSAFKLKLKISLQKMSGHSNLVSSGDSHNRLQDGPTGGFITFISFHDIDTEAPNPYRLVGSPASVSFSSTRFIFSGPTVSLCIYCLYSCFPFTSPFPPPLQFLSLLIHLSPSSA